MRLVRELPDEAGPRPRYSLPRVLTALVLVASFLFLAQGWVRTALVSSATGPLPPTWFGAYVDATLTPVDQFQDANDDPDRQVVLGFVVAASPTSCTPSWGGYYSLSGAEQSLQLGSRIAQMRANGGHVIVSFGGQANSELATACSTVPGLESAYHSVVSRYALSAIDFDVEGAALSDESANLLRAKAVAALQKTTERAHHHLAVWLTLPSDRNGLTPAGTLLVTEMLRAGVTLAGVNAMAMDFGPPEAQMLAVVERDLGSVHRQLIELYRRAGVTLTQSDAWEEEGVTVMIGQNDDAGEAFGLKDAQGLAHFVRARHLGRVSLWSLNRDEQCGSDFAITGVHSNSCSGVSERPLAFDRLFASSFPGTLSASSASSATSTRGPITSANYPYPLWQPGVPYSHGYKVVWQGNIYQAKWFNQGQDPNEQVAYAYQTPWQLIGPVLPTDHAPTTTTLPPTTAPAWSPKTVYQAGDEVLFDGLPYRARWYNVASSPAATVTDPTGSPWQPLFTIPGEPSLP